MKRKNWSTAVRRGLALAAGCAAIWMSGTANSQESTAPQDEAGLCAEPASGGKGAGGKGNSGKGNSGKGAGGRSGGGSPSHGGGGRGAIHVPPPHAGVRPAPHRNPSSLGNRSPALSRPDVVDRRGPGPGARPPVQPATHTRIGPAGGRGQNTAGRPVVVRPGDAARHGGDGFDRRPVRRADAPRAAIGARPFVGNTVDFRDRQYHVGHGGYQPAYYRHSAYHGYWNGNRGFGSHPSFGYGHGYRGGYGPGWGWGSGAVYGYPGGRHVAHYRPFGWGLGGWGLGAVIYNSGYLGYANPYYVTTSSSVYNYSLPIPVLYNESMARTQDDANSADEIFAKAAAAFKEGDYDEALDITDKGIVAYPDDAVLHEFRALALFAKRDYQQAAATIHAVLAVGPGWDWTTLSSMYPSVAAYAAQARDLATYVKTHPQDAASRFLLAYHYMSSGRTELAAAPLRDVVRLKPDDRVAADLLRMVEAPAEEGTAAADRSLAANSPDEPARPAVKPIDKAALVGAWKSTRADGAKFALTLTKDEQFTWSFTPQDRQAQEFGGTYSVEGDVLALERKGGGTLVATIDPNGDDKFNFKLVGAPEDDQGIDFRR